jgi:hypothetical protein
VVPLAERPELCAVVGRWHWQRWGSEDLADAFFEGGCVAYLAPPGAPFGYAGAVVAVLIFYELVQRRSLEEAVDKLHAIDDELAMWRLFRPGRPATTRGATA